MTHDEFIIEREFIPNFFKDFPKGRFLEIGANDGEPENPNEPVWSLVEMGWSGVYCEPNPHSCSRLLKNIKPYKDIIVFNGAITETRGLSTFYVSDEYPMASSFDPLWMPKQYYVKPNTEQYSIITSTITLQDLVNCVGSDFDCISLDIECEMEVYEKIICSFDWSLFHKCKMLVLEGGTLITSEYFKSLGFVYAGKSETNLILTK
jgi:FkbM family methyltransferase